MPGSLFTTTLKLPPSSDVRGWATLSSEWSVLNRPNTPPIPFTPRETPQTGVMVYRGPQFQLVTAFTTGAPAATDVGASGGDTSTPTPTATSGSTTPVVKPTDSDGSGSEPGTLAQDTAAAATGSGSGNNAAGSSPASSESDTSQSTSPSPSASDGTLTIPPTASLSAQSTNATALPPPVNGATGTHRTRVPLVAGLAAGLVLLGTILVLFLFLLHRRRRRREAAVRADKESRHASIETTTVTASGLQILALNRPVAYSVTESQEDMLRKIAAARQRNEAEIHVEVQGTPTPPTASRTEEAAESNALLHNPLVRAMAERMAQLENELRGRRSEDGVAEQPHPPEYTARR